MSDKSNIEWTDATWNPLRGCTKVSPGCKHCYAETFAERWRGVPGHAYEQGFDLMLAPHKLTGPQTPLRWKRPRTIFVNSMSDLFHERVPIDYIRLVVEVMRQADWHTFQLLTKRAPRLEVVASWPLPGPALGLELLPNVIVGVSVEDRKYGVPRIANLQRARVGARFLSIEPLLEDLGELDLTRIDWVIVGGESGPGARPMKPEWVHGVRLQCEAQGVPFFFKQWGGVDKKKAGRLLDDGNDQRGGGRTYDGAPALVTAPVPSDKERRRRRLEVEQGLAKLHPLRVIA